MTLQHIVDWTSGESYFAIIQDGRVLKALKHCRNWKEARAEFSAARS